MKLFKTISGAAVLAALLLSISSCEDPVPFTGVKLTADSYNVDADGSVEVCATYYNEGNADSSSSVTFTLSSDTTGGAYFGETTGTTEITAVSGSSVTLTLGSNSSSSVKVSATCSGSSESKTIYTKEVVSISDTPTGYAGEEFTAFYDSSKVVTVSTKTNLVSYAKAGGYTIFVDGMIDMSDGMLPSTGGGSTTELDSFVASNSDYSTYSEYNYAKCKSVSSSADWTNPLNSTYGNKIRLTVASNTAIIGKSSDCGIKGGNIYINGKSNVILRNLVIQDGYDPFPNHEANDGWNAQQDAICIRNSKAVWVDHCTIEDTLHLSTGANGEKWQTYDGLCDITNKSTYVTVSNCILRNHDKTMLIGSSSSDTSGGYITLNNNYFYNCGQRLPLTAYTGMHIYNNVYNYSGGYYNQQYAIGARYSAYKIIAEGNYFSGISNAFKASTNATGKCYATGNSSTSGGLSMDSSKPFVVPYSYDLVSYSDAASSVPSKSGAGVISVR